MQKTGKIGVLLSVLIASAPVYAADTAVSAPVTLKESDTGFAGSYLSSQFARGQGDVDSAIAYLSDTLAHHPERTDLAAQLISLLVGKGDMEQALVIAKQLEGSPKPDALASLLLLLTSVKNKDFTAASAIITQSFDVADGQLWLPLVDAWIDAGNKNIKQSLTIEEMPITVGRAAAVMNYHLALINAYAGYTEQATLNFSDAVDAPENAPLRVMQQMKVFYDNHHKPAQLEGIIEAYKAAHPDALSNLESPIASPADGIAEVLYSMGSVMQMAGVQNDAVLYLQLARYVRPDFTLAAFSLADVLYEGKAYDRAIAVLSSIPKESQYAMKAQLREAIILDRMDKPAEALTLLDRLSKAQPKALDPLIAKGDLLRVHGRFLEAVIVYDAALARIGKTPNERAWVLHYARGACLEQLGRWKEAKVDLQKSIVLSPDQPEVLNYLGYGMLSRGEEIDDAKAMLEKALALRPNDPQIIDSMGWALYLRGEYKAALPYLERAVELLAADPTVNDHLGDLYWRLERKAEARYQWKRALTYSPAEADMTKINAKIATGLPPATAASTTSAAAENTGHVTQ